MTLTDETARHDAQDAPDRPASGPAARAVVLVAAAGAGAAVAAGLLAGGWWSERSLTFALVVAVLVPVTAASRRHAPWVAAAFVAAWFGLLGLYAVAKGLDAPIPVDRAIGGGSYYGTPYVPTQVASGVALIAAFAIAALVSRARGAAPRLGDAPGRRARPWVVAVGTGLVALVLLPSPWQRLSVAALRPIEPTWDDANLMTWGWLVENGYRPVRDFFYPYGHAYAFNAIPWGPTWRWLAEAAMLAVTAWAFWRLSGRSAIRTLAAVAFIGALFNGVAVVDRYYCGLLIGLVYAAIGPGAHRRPTFGHLLLGLVTLYAAWYEPDLLLFGVGAMVFLALGEIVSGGLRLPPREALRRLAVDASPLAAVLLLPLIWAAEGTLEENTRFWLALRATSVASSRNEDIFSPVAQLTFGVTGTTLSVTLPLLLLIAGLVLARSRSREARGAARLFLVSAAACEVMLAKHLVRDVGSFVALIGVTLAAPAMILLWTRRNLALVAAIGVFAGVAAFAFQRDRVLTGFAEAAADVPAAVVDNAELPSRYAEVREAERRLYAPSRFASWVDADIAAKLQELRGGDAGRRFAVVGDSPIVYVLLGQPPPYHVDLYDASRIEEQRVYLDELRATDPEFIVYRRELFQDGIPPAVRSPLIFDYMIRNYVPVVQEDAYDILARRGSAPIPVDYWRSRLDTLALGAIPGYSTADTAPVCDGGAGCVRYAMLRGHTDEPVEPVLLRITGPDGQAFGAVVNTTGDDDTYPVRLDRLWFSPIVGPDPRVEVQEPTAGWTAKVEGRRTGDDLY